MDASEYAHIYRVFSHATLMLETDSIRAERDEVMAKGPKPSTGIEERCPPRSIPKQEGASATSAYCCIDWNACSIIAQTRKCIGVYSYEY